MKWTKVKEQMPPLNKRIIIAKQSFLGSRIELQAFLAEIRRPFDKDSIYNPDYYCYNTEAIDNGNSQITLTDEDYWLDLEIPEELNGRR